MASIRTTVPRMPSAVSSSVLAGLKHGNKSNARRYCQSYRHLPAVNVASDARARRPKFAPAHVPGPSTSHSTRSLHVSAARQHPPAAPKSKDRGPKSQEDTQTDFGAMNVLSSIPPPTTAVDTCMEDGFALDSGLKVTGSGVLLLGGEAFKWRPWAREGRKEGTIGAGGVGDDNKGVQSMGGKLQNRKGQWDVDASAWGVLDLVWPKPDLLVLGTGPKMLPISPETRKHINELGVRVEVQDTRNAAAQFNLLATERGTQQVAAALIPIGWREGK